MSFGAGKRRSGLFSRRSARRISGRIIWWSAAVAAISALVLLFFLVYDSVSRNLASVEAPESPVEISSGTITSSLGEVLNSRGLSAAEAAGVSAALRKNLNLRRLAPEDEYSIVFSTAGALKYVYIQKGMKRYFAFRKEDGSFSSLVRPVKVSSVVRRFSGTIGSSLWESMSAQGVETSVILDFADVFSWSVDFLTETRSGDAYEVVYESMVTPSGKALSSRVLAGLYDGGETGKKAAFYFKGGYYDEKGNSTRSLFLRAPLQYRRISSYFSRARRHPVLKTVRPHLGIDYAAPSGTPVSSVADGTVVFAGWKGGYGRYVEIRHAAGYATAYGHLSRYARGIRSGRRVRQGDLIAYVGSTGLSTGPHLDFRVKKSGGFVNFLAIKHRSSGGVPAGDKKSFLAAAREILPSAF